MNTSRAFGSFIALVVAAFITGCSGTKSEPVYTDVPGASGSPAVAVPAEAGPPPSAGVSEVTEVTEVTAAEVEAPNKREAAETTELIVTPDDTLMGSIVSVNDVGRFVVLTFPLGKMPAEGSTLFVYRQGLKVGELSVTGPQKDDHTVADITSGECRPKDEVRDR